LVCPVAIYDVTQQNTYT